MQQSPPRNVTRVIVERPQQSQALPALINIFFPGFGQLVQGRLLAGFGWMFAMVVAALSILILVGFVLTPLFYILCIYDAAVYQPGD